MEGFFTSTLDKDAALASIYVHNSQLQHDLVYSRAYGNCNLFLYLPNGSRGNEVNVAVLFQKFDALLKDGGEKHSKEMQSFIKFVNPHYERRSKSIRCDLTGSRVAFNDLWYVFSHGKEVVSRTRTADTGAIVSNTKYVSGFFGTHFDVEMHVIQTDGLTVSKVVQHVQIDSYDGLMALAKLPVELLGAKRKKALTERGKKFFELAHKASHLDYDGIGFNQGWGGIAQTSVRGRVMVDVRAYRVFNANDHVFKHSQTGKGSDSNGNDEDQDGSGDEPVTKKPNKTQRFWMMWPTLPAFCLTTKKWHEVLVSELRPIEFRTNAFEQLVLEPKVKRTIRSIVKMQMAGSTALFGDIIAGKGEGAIFLLYGPPGVGKTSSAEAIAEERQCPLYSITVGELGTSADHLEKNLQRILTTAARWNAVILLDEADIYLEARNNLDVHRNAMVSVFLRLLEYHKGVLFLTTNRVSQFDNAFLSRISIGLCYRDFDQATRLQVWNNLLQAAGSELRGDHALAVHPLNGRQIRTIIRVTGAMAEDDGGRTMTAADLQDTIQLTLDFVEHMK